MYEMLTGFPPFYNNDRKKLFESIKSTEVDYPKYLSSEAVDLLKHFFIKNPEERLGSGPDGIENIKKHKFFASIDWDGIISKKIKPPFKPKIKNMADTKYIDPIFTDCSPKDSYVEEDNINENDNGQYVGFSYEENVAGLKGDENNI